MLLPALAVFAVVAWLVSPDKPAQPTIRPKPRKPKAKAVKPAPVVDEADDDEADDDEIDADDVDDDEADDVDLPTITERKPKVTPPTKDVQ